VVTLTANFQRKPEEGTPNESRVGKIPWYQNHRPCTALYDLERPTANIALSELKVLIMI